ncbi:LacI family DNA-binding transcriptional regulator [Martelella sp. HB161492]|uniref:LacI family DNA-binding transcriptional regulator n=1 Tax=Martelella sp. HB161492 TaxID=2720726 RepID=UPI001592960A|nr:LacI family DNA-binding transcriptional regulator [Martelella sp. HB161492]
MDGQDDMHVSDEIVRTKGRKAASAATLHDIAEASGVSISTVSKVLNERAGVSPDNRARVLQMVEELGYRRPDSKLRTGPEIGSVTIVTFDRYAANDHYYVDTMRGLTDEARHLGWDVALDLALIGDGYTKVSPEALFRRATPESVVLLGIDQPPVVEAVAALGCPAVIVNGMDPMMRLSSISPDHYYGSYAATRHLIEKGHKRFLHVSHIFRDTVAQRVDGMRHALDEAGIGFDPVRNVLDTGSANFSSLDASNAIARLLEEGRFDYSAIVCASDMLAIGVTQALLSAGIRVPEDVSVIGFDDLPISTHCEVPLSTMHIERGEMGRLAIRMLAEQAAGKLTSRRRVSMTMQLVERHSVAPPPGEK